MSESAAHDRNAGPKGHGFTPVEEAVPKDRVFVLAVTHQFRCLASYGKDGVWRDAKSGGVIGGVSAWKPIGD
jgi:hypothetical protein